MRARIGVAIALTTLIGFGTAGCAFITPQATTKVVEAANGVNGNVGTIDIRNATLISDDGETASLLVSFYNSGISTQQLLVQYESNGEKVDEKVFVSGGGTTSFGADGEKQVVLTGLDAQPGSLFPVYFQYGDVEGKQLLIPVLTTEFAEYKGLGPTAVPTDTPVDISTPTPTPDVSTGVEAPATPTPTPAG